MKRRFMLSGLAALVLLNSTQSLNAISLASFIDSIRVVFSSILSRKKTPKQAPAQLTLPEVEPINLNSIELPAAINYFDKNFLKQYEVVHKALVHDGYQQISFLTPDNLRLYGLFLQRPHARATVILCNGFYPGRKETSAPLATLIPEDMNILLFDARAHGNSQYLSKMRGFKGYGMFANISNYGLNEYKDIVGAIQFVAHRTGKPIILHGMCSGAFNAMRAVVKLHDVDELSEYQVKGLICDSGWASIKSASEFAPYAFVEKELTNRYKRAEQTPEQVRQTTSYQSAYNFCSFIICAFKKLFLERGLRKTDATTNLYTKIGNLPIPIFFIHAADDTYSPFKDIEELSQQVTHHYTPWWIEPGVSYHTDHHFKLPIEYRTKMHTFFSYALAE